MVRSGELNANWGQPDAAPILVVCYARPESTAAILEAVLASRPTAHVYVSLDGPKESGDERVLSLRDEVVGVVERFSSILRITFINRQQNVGTNRNIEAAIESIFLDYDRVIVVEDDCLPSSSFFDFCDWGLMSLHSDSRVLIIQGSNHFRWPFNSFRGVHMFSQLSHVWGWATWRDKWEKPSETNSRLGSMQRQGLKKLLRRKLPFASYRRAWLQFLDAGSDRSWDITLQFRIWRENLLVVCPGINLVRNVGFDNVASNSKIIPDHFQNSTVGILSVPPRFLHVPIAALTFLELWSLRKFAISRACKVLATDLITRARRQSQN